MIRGEEGPAYRSRHNARRADALKQLRQRWKTLSEERRKAPDDFCRNAAWPGRRVLWSGLLGKRSATAQDLDYQAIVKETRMARPGR